MIAEINNSTNPTKKNRIRRAIKVSRPELSKSEDHLYSTCEYGGKKTEANSGSR